MGGNCTVDSRPKLFSGNSSIEALTSSFGSDLYIHFVYEYKVPLRDLWLTWKPGGVAKAEGREHSIRRFVLRTSYDSYVVTEEERTKNIIKKLLNRKIQNSLATGRVSGQVTAASPIEFIGISVTSEVVGRPPCASYDMLACIFGPDAEFYCNFRWARNPGTSRSQERCTAKTSVPAASRYWRSTEPYFLLVYIIILVWYGYR